MNSKQEYILAAFGTLSVTLLFAGASLMENGKIGPDANLLIQAFAVFVGLFSVGGSVEKIFDLAIGEFRVSGLWWAAFLAIAGYFARVFALDEANKIFHIDPSALPMTVVAAGVMRFFLWLKWLFIGVTAFSIFGLVFLLKRTICPSESDLKENVAGNILLVSNMVCCGLAALFISNQLDEKGREQKLYRIAHSADFVSEFNCSGIDEKRFSVLFIGPEQRRVLIAPKLPAPPLSLFERPSPEFLQPLKVPSEFPVVECVPATDLERWLKNGWSFRPN